MDTKPSEIIESCGQHLRVGPWHSSNSLAQITPLAAFEPLKGKAVQVGIERAMKSGYRTIYSSALLEHEINGFLKCGFTVKEQLHVLRHSLALTTSQRDVASIKIRKPTRPELEQVVRLDKSCFDCFWTMDVVGLREAVEATSRARFRIALIEESGTETIAGYAITGLGDKRGYLQRLAVDPDHQGKGIAQQLVQDGFGWLRFWRAREEYVNTQTKNERAFNFYLKMGFTLLPERLNILELSLGT